MCGNLYESLAEETPSEGSFDVIVCGGGPAGIGAAVAASRNRAKTLLVEPLNFLGGTATALPVNLWCESPGGRIFDELEKRVTALGGGKREFDPGRHVNRMGRVSLHGETVKAVSAEMAAEAGVNIFFGAQAVKPVLENGIVKSLVFATRDGLRSAGAKVIIDATAEAAVAASAGAAYEKGDPADGRLMHVDFFYRMENTDLEKYGQNRPPEEELLKKLEKALGKGEIRPPENVFCPAPGHFPYDHGSGSLRPTRWAIEKVDCSDPLRVSKVMAECQVAALDVVRFCRKNLPGYEDCAIGRIYGMLGCRESRRIKGLYTLTRDDVLSARKFSDGIARACFFIDFHDSPPGRTVPYDIEFKKKNSPPEGDYYEIPYRCLLPKDIKGILAAGRCISAVRDAMASLRVMPVCMFTGEAAGTAAAISAAGNTHPHEVKAETIRSMMGLDG